MKRSLLRSLIPVYIFIIALLIITAFWGNRAITSFHENKTINSGRTVIIDAGHGGVDGGATSCSGVLESNLNLKIALRLNDLMHLLGISTVMIRTEDISVYTDGNTIAAKKISDLKYRVKTVNSIPDGILISIHQNYFSDGRYSGSQVFYGNNNESRYLAEHVQKALATAIDKENKRKIKKADGIYLMDKIKCTGILVECGFLSNPVEDKKLQDPEYQKKLCAVISSVTSQYIQKDPIA